MATTKRKKGKKTSGRKSKRPRGAKQRRPAKRGQRVVVSRLPRSNARRPKRRALLGTMFDPEVVPGGRTRGPYARRLPMTSARPPDTLPDELVPERMRPRPPGTDPREDERRWEQGRPIDEIGDPPPDTELGGLPFRDGDLDDPDPDALIERLDPPDGELPDPGDLDDD